MFKEIFIRLCNEKGIAPSKACRDVNIAPATFSCWDENSVPRQATLMRIADYFGVTVDYLLGKELVEPLRPASAPVQDAYDRAPEEIKTAVRKLLDI